MERLIIKWTFPYLQYSSFPEKMIISQRENLAEEIKEKRLKRDE